MLFQTKGIKTIQGFPLMPAYETQIYIMFLQDPTSSIRD